MILRVLAVLATIVVPALGLILGEQIRGSLPTWALPSLAALFVSPLWIARPKALLSTVIVAGLAALSSATVLDAGELLRVTGDPDAWPHYDITKEPLPDEARGFVIVDGYLRGEWTLDEYRVESGGRPDQNQDAMAELVPLLGTEGTVVAPEHAGRVVVARVLKRPAHPTGVSTLRGQLQPLPEGILDSLVAFDPKLPKDTITGTLLDTTRIPTRQQAWTQAAIALVASVLALALALLTLAGRDEPKAKVES